MGGDTSYKYKSVANERISKYITYSFDDTCRYEYSAKNVKDLKYVDIKNLKKQAFKDNYKGFSYTKTIYKVGNRNDK